MTSRAIIAMLIALSAQPAAAVQGAAAPQTNSGSDETFHKASARQFLPPLEYGLPVGLASDRLGWVEVQHILQSRGLMEVDLNGAPDAATLKALRVYLDPLAERLVARVELAEARAMRASGSGQAEPGPFRHGNWSETETEGQYSGEMYFPYAGDPSPAGYVGVSGSGWPHMSEYYRPGDRRGSPLCRLTRFSPQRPGYLNCKLLDGLIEIRERDGMREIIFSVDEQPVARFVTWLGYHGGEDRHRRWHKFTDTF